jgi:uncharacterized protein YggT (Ycf19 family)
MALYVLNSFVYLGNHGFLAYVNLTAQRLLSVIRWLPLRMGKFDFAPLVMIGLVYGLEILLYRGLEWKMGIKFEFRGLLHWLFQQAS